MRKIKKIPREKGLPDFAKYAHGLAEAARKVALEEQLLLKFEPTPGAKVN